MNNNKAFNISAISQRKIISCGTQYYSTPSFLWGCFWWSRFLDWNICVDFSVYDSTCLAHVPRTSRGSCHGEITVTIISINGRLVSLKPMLAQVEDVKAAWFTKPLAKVTTGEGRPSEWVITTGHFLHLAREPMPEVRLDSAQQGWNWPGWAWHLCEDHCRGSDARAK